MWLVLDKGDVSVARPMSGTCQGKHSGRQEAEVISITSYQFASIYI